MLLKADHDGQIKKSSDLEASAKCFSSQSWKIRNDARNSILRGIPPEIAI
jgi:hypothetical protein